MNKGIDYKWCFATGWREGALGVAPDTNRGVSARYPDMSSDEITAYLNGAEDGRAGDRWRMDEEGNMERAWEDLNLDGREP